MSISCMDERWDRCSAYRKERGADGVRAKQGHRKDVCCGSLRPDRQLYCASPPSREGDLEKAQRPPCRLCALHHPTLIGARSAPLLLLQPAHPGGRKASFLALGWEALRGFRGTPLDWLASGDELHLRLATDSQGRNQQCSKELAYSLGPDGNVKNSWLEAICTLRGSNGAYAERERN